MSFIKDDSHAFVSLVGPAEVAFTTQPVCVDQVYFDDGESVDLSDDEEELRRQMDRLEDGGFDKYKAYLDGAQLNLEVGLYIYFLYR